jgi:hypothetical protein
MAEKKTQALSLLQGILEETQSEAQAERERLAADLRNREEAERQAAEEAERRRRVDAERRLAEEDARQRAAAERRAAELERIRIDDLKARGLWQEPKAPEPVEAAPTAAPVARPTMSTQDATALQALAARKARRGPLLAAAVVLLAAAGGGGGFWYAQSIEHVDSTTTYAKAEVRTAERALASASIGFNQIPDPVVLAAPTPEPAATTSRPSRPRGSGSSSSTASSTSRPPRIQLGGSLGRE